MARPILFAIDDDTEVLRAVDRDLRRQYGEHYRVMRASSGPSALEALEQLKTRKTPVALFLVDQRMPQMSGVEFLERAIPLFPAAKRVLLTAYADTDAAIHAINTARVDYYLLKPWDPPEQRLYPVLDDLLGDWQANFRPPFEGIRVVGHRWSPEAFQVRDFLARHQVPYQWLDVEEQAEARELVETAEKATGDEKPHLPLVFLADGTWLADPSRGELAERIGFKTQAEKPFYDLAIVGGGPSGLAAAVYGASEGLRTLLIEGDAPGGQAGTSSRIENYLGFPAGLSGADLTRRAVTQAQRFGVEILTPQEAKGVRLEDPYRFIVLGDGSEVSCHALLIATGVSYRKLDVPGVDQLTGAGIYYGAAMTEAMACRDEDVFIVGGANSAGQAAMYFSRYARRIVMLVRGDSLNKGMSQYLVDQIGETPGIEVWYHTNVAAAHGEDHLESIDVHNSETEEVTNHPARSLFILIGAQPHTGWLEGIVERDKYGFILSGPELMHDGKRPEGWTPDRDPFLLETSVPGIFVAGDVRRGSVKRVASGVGEGSIAISFIHQYLSKL
ncbi:MAG: thioredoxin reductase [Acidobacteriota bacterium]|jgi:thioredoxin reductase (NADPH)|nr:thioredoxin reductase [Acidobacteriota bacterium]